MHVQSNGGWLGGWRAGWRWPAGPPKTTPPAPPPPQLHMSCNTFEVKMDMPFGYMVKIFFNLHKHNQHRRTAHMYVKLATKRRYTMG